MSENPRQNPRYRGDVEKERGGDLLAIAARHGVTFAIMQAHYEHCRAKHWDGCTRIPCATDAWAILPASYSYYDTVCTLLRLLKGEK